ncbi:unnamed protein product [Hapterophycus canaliculatus]
MGTPGRSVRTKRHLSCGFTFIQNPSRVGRILWMQGVRPSPRLAQTAFRGWVDPARAQRLFFMGDVSSDCVGTSSYVYHTRHRIFLLVASRTSGLTVLACRSV